MDFVTYNYILIHTIYGLFKICTQCFITEICTRCNSNNIIIIMKISIFIKFLFPTAIKYLKLTQFNYSLESIATFNQKS